jgi:hypothetical protein
LYFPIDGLTVSVLASRVVDRCFESRSGQSKDYKIGICCFSAKHGSLRRKSKDWLARNQDNAHTTLFLLLVNKGGNTYTLFI